MAEAFLFGIGGGGPSTVLSAVTLTSDGTYLPSQFGVDGFSEVTVSVSAGAVTLTDQQLFLNGRAESFVDSTITELSGLDNQYYMSIISVPNVTRIYSITTNAARELYAPSCTQLTSIMRMSYLESITLNLSSYHIGFYGCCTLPSLPYIISSFISETTFYNCHRLSVLSIASDIAGTVPASAFYQCFALESFVTSASIGLNTGTFNTCAAMTNISIPNIISMNTSPFVGSFHALLSLTYNNVNANVTFTGFTNLLSLTTNTSYALTLSNRRIEYISAPYASAITAKNCYFLSYVYAPGIRSMLSTQFQGCIALRTIVLESCSVLSSLTFDGCKLLRSVYLLSNAVCNLVTISAFRSTAFSHGFGNIYVPSSLVDSYKTSTNWVQLSKFIIAYSEE